MPSIRLPLNPEREEGLRLGLGQSQILAHRHDGVSALGRLRPRRSSRAARQPARHRRLLRRRRPLRPRRLLLLCLLGSDHLVELCLAALANDGVLEFADDCDCLGIVRRVPLGEAEPVVAFIEQPLDSVGLFRRTIAAEPGHRGAARARVSPPDARGVGRLCLIHLALGLVHLVFVFVCACVWL